MFTRNELITLSFALVSVAIIVVGIGYSLGVL
jgi:hypothetical protein